MDMVTLLLAAVAGVLLGRCDRVLEAQLPGGPQRLAISQGVDMGRPSQIGVLVGAGGVTVTGQAVKTMAGRLFL